MPDLSDEKRRKIPRLREKLLEGRRAGATYMLVLRNTGTDEEVILFVEGDKKPREALVDHVAVHGSTFDPVECYDMSMDLNAQLQSSRAYNWDKDLPVFTGPFTAVYPAE